MPKLVEMSRDLEDQGVSFVGISIDSPRNVSKIKPFARSMGVTYPILVDPSGELMGELNVLAVPTLLVVNRDMEVVYVHEGFNAGDELEIREEIENLLAD
jgi:peroxiredoxin